MSEYQYVAFRAIDGPVSEANLAYMQQQSSRAEITPWSFENEYHFGDFRGNPLEMLRRGYDIHLHYANFGTRKLLLRLPQGIPDPPVIRSYMEKESLVFLKDKQGLGGCLSIEPFYDGGRLDELWDIKTLIDRLVPLRHEILEGDLRPWYLAHLAMMRDDNHDPDETEEGPVPAGLDDLTDAQLALAELYGIDSSLIEAAAAESLPLPVFKSGTKSTYTNWILRQPEAAKNEWLTALLDNPASPVRQQILAQYRKEVPVPTWPTTQPARTITQLEEAASEIAAISRGRSAAKAVQARKKRLAQMAADPSATLLETERLVEQRGSDSYHQAAQLLADLREALSESGRSGVAEKQAEKLKAKYPTLTRLTSELRRQGFVPKR